MNLTVDEITKSITGKPSLHDCDIEELKQVTTQYPFFGPARFLLAKKLGQENASLNSENIQKASLYFQNPVWYHHLLNGPGFINSYIPPQSEAPAYPHAEKEAPFTHEQVVGKWEVEQVEVKNEVEMEAEVEIAVERTELTEPKLHVAEDEADSHAEPLQEEPMAGEKPLVLPNFKFEPIDTSSAELTFEPYHTVDYFASQGIQAKDEEKPQDKFGKQLKSFTEWLKILKKVPASELGAAVNQAEEQKVEKLAEVSINDREVVTETMAEVWEKQGNPAKATEVYRKLSLLNPSKSSYFAAKIEQLKNL